MPNYLMSSLLMMLSFLHYISTVVLSWHFSLYFPQIIYQSKFIYLKEHVNIVHTWRSVYPWHLLEYWVPPSGSAHGADIQLHPSWWRIWVEWPTLIPHDQMLHPLQLSQRWQPVHCVRGQTGDDLTWRLQPDSTLSLLKLYTRHTLVWHSQPVRNVTNSYS